MFLTVSRVFAMLPTEKTNVIDLVEPESNLAGLSNECPPAEKNTLSKSQHQQYKQLDKFMVDERQIERNRAPFVKRKGFPEREQHSRIIESTLPPTKRVLLDDGLSRSRMPTLTTKLQMQRERELNINPHNPMYIRTLSYNLRLAANDFTFVGRVILKNERFGIILEGDANDFQLSNVHLPHRVNVWKLDSRDPEKHSYMLRQDKGTLRTSVPYDAITAFGIPIDEIPVSDYQLRTSLYEAETNLQELQMKFDNLKLENDKLSDAESTLKELQMRFDNLRLEKDQLSQDRINAKKMGDVRQDREKRSAELLNIERQITQKCAETLQKYEKTCHTFVKNEKI